MKTSLYFVFTFLTIGFTNQLLATNYYVSNTGSNSNNGLTPGASFLTIQYAADQVDLGDTVFVANGTYAGFDLRDAIATLSQPIVFKAMGNNVLINNNGPLREDGINIEDCAHIIINGFICNNMVGNGNGIRIVTSEFCVIRNNRCDNNAERGIFTGFTDDILIEHNVCTNSVGEHGIYVSNSSDRPIIRYNECHGNNWAGIHLNGDLSAGGDGIIHDPKIYGNSIHDNNQGGGINMDGVLDAVIYNNIIYNNHFCQGIVLFKEDGAIVSSGAKIYNNTIIVPSDGRWGILVHDGGNMNTRIYNNIIINQHSSRGCIGVWSTNQFASDYNIVNNRMSDVGDDGGVMTLAQWQALGFDLNSQVSDPLTSIFDNPATFNYHLVNNCQAVDAGTTLVSSVVTVDYDQLTRPSGSGFDVGAFEDGSVLGLLDPVNEQTLTLYPNPATDYFTIPTSVSGKSIQYLELLSLDGKMIRSYAGTDQSTFSTHEIPQGLYLVQVTWNDHSTALVKVRIQ